MTPNEVILRCQAIAEEAGLEDRAVNVSNFLDYADFIRDIIAAWPKGHAATLPWFRDFAATLRKMRDDLDTIVRADPQCLYKPAHHVALEFQKSLAYIRYFRGPNRTSKTQTGTNDNYCVLTGQHPYRPRPPLPSAVAIVGTDFQKYSTKVYLPKYLTGEGGNPLSPVFPEGGKWFHSYDQRSYTIIIACPECAEAGKAGRCRHPKASITLFSDNKGPGVLAGGQYAQVQFDEQVSEEFFPEALKRIETVPNSGIIVTETPIGGKGFWTHKVLTRDATAGKLVPGTIRPLVSLHTIDQFSAGLSDPAHIRASMELMSPAEVEARVYGRPAAFSETGVFDSMELSRMHDEAETPRYGDLSFDLEGRDVTFLDALVAARRGLAKLVFAPMAIAPLAVWRTPAVGQQYLLCGDVAQGLTNRDYSCLDVLQMNLRNGTIYLEQVAQLHGWINPRNLAIDAAKLASWYNNAIVVPERNGPGHEFIRTLKEFGYWNIYQQQADPAQAAFGLDPSLGIELTAANKSTLISCLQQTIKDRRTGERTLTIHSVDTLEELGAYEQRTTEVGNVKFAGISGTNDDRVSSLVIGVYAAKVLGVYNFAAEAHNALERIKDKLTPEEFEIWREVHAEDEKRRRQEAEFGSDYVGMDSPFG